MTGVYPQPRQHSTRGERKELLLWDEYHAASGESCFMLAMDDPAEAGVSTLYDYLYRQRKHKRRAEATRLLYVGATRAVQRLYAELVGAGAG